MPSIYSREEIEKLIEEGFPENRAVISFYTPGEQPVDYKGKAERLLQIGIHDIGIDVLSEFGLTYDTYFAEAKKVARFIFNAYEDKRSFICQCNNGHSISAACAAAICQWREGNSISFFRNCRYYPNLSIYCKLSSRLLFLDKAKNRYLEREKELYWRLLARHPDMDDATAREILDMK